MGFCYALLLFPSCIMKHCTSQPTLGVQRENKEARNGWILATRCTSLRNPLRSAAMPDSFAHTRLDSLPPQREHVHCFAIPKKSKGRTQASASPCVPAWPCNFHFPSTDPQRVSASHRGVFSRLAKPKNSSRLRKHPYIRTETRQQEGYTHKAARNNVCCRRARRSLALEPVTLPRVAVSAKCPLLMCAYMSHRWL